MSKQNGAIHSGEEQSTPLPLPSDPELAELEQTVIIRRSVVAQIQFATVVGGVEVQVFPPQQISFPANDEGCAALLRTVEREEQALQAQVRQARDAARGRGR